MFNIRTENICYINVQKANSCALKSPPPRHSSAESEKNVETSEEMKKNKKKRDCE